MPGDCFDNKLSCKEKGRQFQITFPKNAKETICRAKVDGCIIPKNSLQERCDYMFMRCVDEDIYFVELKGQGIKKAYSQIISTIEFARPLLKFKQEQVTGFIIGSRCPLASAEVQKLKKDFKSKKYGHLLEVHSRKWTHRVGAD